MQTVSLLIITNNIDTCRKYVFKNLKAFDENIIVLTDGSTILPPSHKTKIYNYEWNDNFSDAVNFGLQHCACDWVFRLDSDEFILDNDVEKLYQSIESHDHDYYLINIFSFYEDPYIIKKPDLKAGFLPRLFKNNKKIYYENIVHEQNYKSIQNEQLRGGIINNFGIHHFGEIGCKDGDGIHKHKKQYYHELILKQIEYTPEDARYYEFAGNYHYHREEYREALVYIQKASELCHPEKLPYYLSKRMELLKKLKIQRTIPDNVIQIQDKLHNKNILNDKTENDKLSVVIPVYNEMQLTDDLLNDISNNSIIPEEIILIDNASEDNMLELTKKYDKLNIKYIRNNENIGVCQAWNQGVTLAQNKYISILNNDIIINNFFFDKIIKVMQQHNDIGIVTPKAVSFKEEVINNNDEPRIVTMTRGREGWAFTIKKEILDKIGLIPTQYKFWFGDDIWFNGTRKAGYKTVMIENNYIYHYISITLKKVQPNQQIEKEKILWAINS